MSAAIRNRRIMTLATVPENYGGIESMTPEPFYCGDCETWSSGANGYCFLRKMKRRRDDSCTLHSSVQSAEQVLDKFAVHIERMIVGYKWREFCCTDDYWNGLMHGYYEVKRDFAELRSQRGEREQG
jgi:hypothetical protein